MSPYEFLRDGVLRYLTEFSQEWSLLVIDVKAVTEADFMGTDKLSWLWVVGVHHLTTASLITSEGFLAHLLGETESQEAIFDLFLLCLNLFKRVFIFVDFHYYKKLSNL